MASPELPKYLTARLPDYTSDCLEWDKWRCVFRGGVTFRDRYLQKMSRRETVEDFSDRRNLSPIPTDGADGIHEIRNSIFQRLGDVLRRGGSNAYQSAVNGEGGGVDLRGSSMNFFLGDRILTDLLVMGSVGVFVDMPQINGVTLADAYGKRPYLYTYQREDILNYSLSSPDLVSEYKSILLRDTCANFDQCTGLQLGTVQRYRMLWLNEQTNRVHLQFFDLNGNKIGRDGSPGGEIILNINRIPFVSFDIRQSLMGVVADDNICLLNMASLDSNYAIKSNFVFYTEQRDGRMVGSHLKRVGTDGSAMQGGQGSADEDIKVGITNGRYYDMEAERPGFIAPPTGPIEASMKLQEKMEHRIRRKLNLAIQTMATRASAESKGMDNQALDSGLSFIGLVLQGGESKIADYWAAYEEVDPNRRKIATVKYPDKYSLKTDQDRIDEASSLSELAYTIPSRKAKKELGKLTIDTLFTGKVPVDDIQAMKAEVDKANYTTSDPEIVAIAKEQGLAGDKTLSMSLGYDEDEYLKGKADHLERAKNLIEAQSSGTLKNPAARGVNDLSPDPGAARAEKKASRNTDLQPTTKKRIRGKGKRNAPTN